MYRSIALATLLISAAVAYRNGAPDEACSSRVPNHGVAGQTGICPYDFVALGWEPGQFTSMGVFPTVQGDTREFKGFLASVFYQGEPIGEMRPGRRSDNVPPTARVKSACRKTSLTHANNNPKQEIFFEWKAPTDLPTDAVVELRLTIVEEQLRFWVDCNNVRLGSLAANPVESSASPTSTSSSTSSSSSSSSSTTTAAITRAPTTRRTPRPRPSTTLPPPPPTPPTTISSTSSSSSSTSSTSSTAAPTTPQTVRPSPPTRQPRTRPTAPPRQPTTRPTQPPRRQPTIRPTQPIRSQPTTFLPPTTRQPNTRPAPTQRQPRTRPAPRTRPPTTARPTQPQRQPNPRPTPPPRQANPRPTYAPRQTNPRSIPPPRQPNPRPTHAPRQTNPRPTHPPRQPTHRPTHPQRQTRPQTQPTTRQRPQPTQAPTTRRPTHHNVPPSNTGGKADSYLSYSQNVALKHTTMGDSECEEYGNVYRIAPGSDCRHFTQSIKGGRLSTTIVKCPGATRFDPRVCSCAFTYFCQVA